MIIPSIDIMGGRAVQLRQGRELLLTDRRDPVELAAYFNRFGPVAVVDLDAALGRGSNTELIERCCRVATCRVGGGIRSPDDVRNWIKRGADQVVIGTMASVEFLRQFPRSWLIVALDARGTRVVDRGWTRDTGADLFARAAELAPHCSEFLFTQVEREGMLAGCDLETAVKLREAAKIPVTVAGGIRSNQEIAELERQGFNSQVGRALYEEKIDLAAAWGDTVAFDDAGLAPTIVQDAGSGDVLMLAWSNRASLERALRDGGGWYWSRSRKELWRKGATSGNTQDLVAARYDCDRDTILFQVRQTGPACHNGAETCFGRRRPRPLETLIATLHARRDEIGAGAASYTQALIGNPELLAAKLREETQEVIDAPDRDNLRWECADLIYHLMVRMVQGQLSLDQVESELRGRMKP